MNYSIIQKISIALVMIVFITFLIIKLFANRVKATSIHLEMMSLMDENDKLSKNEENNPEGDDDDDEINSYEKQEGGSNVIEGLSAKDFLGKLSKPQSWGEEIKKGGEELGKKVKDEVGGPLEEIFRIVKEIGDAFNSIPARATAFTDAFELVGQGIKLEFVNLGESLDLGFKDVFNLIETVGKCGIKTIENLRTCIIWYILDLLGSTLYNIIVVLPVFMIRMITGFDMQPYVNAVHNAIEYVDSMFFGLTCYHLIHYPPWVIEKCYSCNYDYDVKKLKYDWETSIPALMKQPTQKFLDAEKKFKSIFNKKM